MSWWDSNEPKPIRNKLSLWDSNEPNKEQLNRTENVADWLSARYLLKSLDDEVIISCYDKVIESFDGKKDIIKTLVKASTPDQIKCIVQILKDAQLKQIEGKYEKIMVKYAKDQEKNKSYFDYLSIESIFNICEFLDKNDMNTFKLTSTSNALISFDIMRSYKMGIFNMNELIEQNYYKYPLHLKVDDKIKTNRVKPFTKYQSLLNMYSKRYNISLNHMLILQSYRSPSWEWNLSTNSSYDTFGPLSQASMLNNIYEFMDEKIPKNKAFYFLDQKKIIKLDNSDKLECMSSSNKMKIELKSHNVVLLQYFDRFQQRIQNIQFLWLDPSTSSSRFTNYILNDLYSIYTKIYTHLSSSWCNQMLYEINRMKKFMSNSDEALIKIYFSEQKSILDDIRYNEYEAVPISSTVAIVDEHCPNQNCHVFKENSIIYDAMLNKINMVSNNNKFYKIQVLKANDGDQYYTYFRFGRVGSIGGYLMNGGTKNECIAAFKKTFNDKTRNHWDNRINFSDHGAYTYLPRISASKSSDFKVITFELNHCHSFFKSQVDGNQAMKLKKFEPFYDNVQEYMTDQTAKYKLKISNMDSFPEFDQQIIHFDTDKKLDVNITATDRDLEFNVTPDTTFEMIQNQISRYFQDIIPPNRIQLYLVMKNMNATYMERLFNFKMERQYVGYSDKINSLSQTQYNYLANTFHYISIGSCHWQIVPYDTLFDDEYDICKLSIYEAAFASSNSYSAFTFATSPVFTLYVRHKHNITDNNDIEENKESNENKKKDKQLKHVTVKDLMQDMMNMVLHPMYGDVYKSLIDKFNETEKYSFVIMKGIDVKNKQFKCYDMDNEYDYHVESNKMSGTYYIDVLIVLNDKKLLNGDDTLEGFPIFVRLCKYGPYHQYYHPKKIWITKKTKVQEIVDECFEIDANKYKFKSSISKYGNMSNGDNVFEHFYRNHEYNIDDNELLISLQIIE